MDSSIPFYLQVKNDIKNKVLEGDLRPGDSIQSERELMEQFGLSRSTIRKAIKELVYEGYLVKVQGKGTFVSKHNIEKNLVKVTNIRHKKHKNDACSNTISYETLSENLLSADDKLNKLLKNISDGRIYYLERKVILDDIVVGIDKIWSSPDFINKITDQSVDNIENMGNKIIEEINIVHSNKEQSRKLDIEVDTPLLGIDKKIYKDKLIIYIQSIYNSKRVKLTKMSSQKNGIFSRNRVEV